MLHQKEWQKYLENQLEAVLIWEFGNVGGMVSMHHISCMKKKKKTNSL